MLDKNRFTGKMGKKNTYSRETEFPTYISNWSNHYNAWKNLKKNYLLIKYEDLIENPKDNFKKVTKYLSNLLKMKIDKNDLDDAILMSSFKNLKQSEEKFGFSEAAPDKITNRKKKFFNLGPDNIWEENLPENIRKEIEITFNEEMKELSYL